MFYFPPGMPTQPADAPPQAPLTEQQLGQAEAQGWLDIVRGRVTRQMTGADWQVAWCARHGRDPGDGLLLEELPRRQVEPRLLGPGDYVQPFVELMNQRGMEYADFNYTEDGPSYPFMRHLGYEIQQIMGSEQENRWVIDQVMDKDGYEVYQQLNRVIDGLFD